MNVRYHGSPYHKRYPSEWGAPGLRSDKSECPPEIPVSNVVAVLEEAIPRAIAEGACSLERDGEWPRYAWGRSVFETKTGEAYELVWEARVENRGIPEYKAYPGESWQTSRFDAARCGGRAVAGLTLEFEPLAADGVLDAAEAATWGRLHVRVADQVLTRVFDRRAQATRDGVDGTVLPLAEWLVRNWFVVFESTREPTQDPQSRARQYRWLRSHCIRYSGEGAALPNVCFFRSGPASLRAVWQRDPPGSGRFEPVEFTTEDGHAELPFDSAREALKDFVDSTVRRCLALAPDSPRTKELSEAWDAVLNPSSDRHALMRFVAKLDEALPRIPPKALGRLAQWHERGEPVTSALLDCADVDRLDDVESAVALVSAHLATTGPTPNRLRELRQAVHPSEDAVAWIRGWSDARALRRALGRAEDEPVAELPRLEAMADVPLALLSPRDALVAWEAGREPAVFGSKAASPFIHLRNAWPAVFFGTLDQRSACLLSPGLAGLTPVANAFATELLAPREAVRALLAGRTCADGDDIHEIANQLNAPWQCVRHQLQNHKLADVRV